MLCFPRWVQSTSSLQNQDKIAENCSNPCTELNYSILLLNTYFDEYEFVQFSQIPLGLILHPFLFQNWTLRNGDEFHYINIYEYLRLFKKYLMNPQTMLVKPRSWRRIWRVFLQYEDLPYLSTKKIRSVWERVYNKDTQT